jgi:hypothetical protein
MQDRELTIINPDRTWYLQAENEVSAPHWAEVLLRRTEYLRTGRSTALPVSSTPQSARPSASSALTPAGSLSSMPANDLSAMRLSPAASPSTSRLAREQPPPESAAAVSLGGGGGGGGGGRLVFAPDNSDSDGADGESSTDPTVRL